MNRFRNRWLAAAAIISLAFVATHFKLSALRADPVKPSTNGSLGSETPDAGVANLFNDKIYPNNIDTSAIDSTYHFITVADPQGRSGTYATRGNMLTIGGETFLVAYYMPLTSDMTAPITPKPNSTAHLILINLKYMTVIFDVHKVGEMGSITDSAIPR